MRIEIEADDTPAYQLPPELAVYRKTTAAFLRKFFRMSMELGHLPSLLGREFFRTHVTSYSTYTFEDAVIFTHDVERCLESLPEKMKQVLALIVFQEFSQEEAAELMGVSLRSMERWHAEALDRAAEVFVRHKLLEPIKIASSVAGPTRQESPDTEGKASSLPPKKPAMSTREATPRSLRRSKVNG